jgi:hypothetical protein
MEKVIAGDTLQNKVTGEFGTAKSGVKKDGTVTVKLPSWKGSKPVQWKAEDIEVFEP